MSLLAFASGFAKATGAAALREDDRRAEQSKEIYEQAMKQRELALSLNRKQAEENKKRMEYVQTIKGTVIDGAQVSAAEAFKLYDLTAGDPSKVKDVVKEGLIKISGSGQLVKATGEGWSAGSAIPEGMGGEEGEGSFLFGSTSTAAVGKAQDRLKGVGDVAGPTTYAAIGVESGNMSTADAPDDALKNPSYNWTVSIPDGEGGFKDVPAMTSSSGVYIYGDDGKPQRVPAGYKELRKNVNKTQKETTLGEALNVVDNLITADTRKNITAATQAYRSHETLSANYERLAEYALNRDNYASIKGFVGSLSTKAEIEVLGLVSLMGNTPEGKEKRDANYWAGVLSKLEQNRSALGDAKDVATNAKIMQNIALEMAINDLVGSGDSRPSDFDVRSRMAMYLADSPEQFLKQAANNMDKSKDNYSGAVGVLNSVEGGLSSLQDLSTRESASTAEREAAQLLYNNYTRVSNAELSRPEFLTRYEEGEEGLITGSEMESADSEATVDLNFSNGILPATFDAATNTFTVVVNGEPLEIDGDVAVRMGYLDSDVLKELLGEL